MNHNNPNSRATASPAPAMFRAMGNSSTPIAFIRRISADHPEWGEDRIALELRLKCGVEHSPSTVRR